MWRKVVCTEDLRRQGRVRVRYRGAVVISYGTRFVLAGERGEVRELLLVVMYCCRETKEFKAQSKNSGI
jgi:hypothetical protein